MGVILLILLLLTKFHILFSPILPHKKVDHVLNQIGITSTQEFTFEPLYLTIETIPSYQTSLKTLSHCY